MSKRGNDLLIQLKTTRHQAGERCHERIKIAHELFTSHQDVLLDKFGGLEAARVAMNDEYFDDLCGLVNFDQLLAIYEAFPQIEDWKAAKFNLSVMLASWQAKNKQERKEDAEATGRTRRAAKLSDLERAQQDVSEFQYALKREKEMHESTQERLRRLEQENHTLREQNAELRGRVGEMERMLERKFAAA